MTLLNEVRKILSKKSSRVGWEKLIKLFRTWENPEEIELCLEYTKQHLQTWNPEHLIFEYDGYRRWEWRHPQPKNPNTSWIKLISHLHLKFAYGNNFCPCCTSFPDGYKDFIQAGATHVKLANNIYDSLTVEVFHAIKNSKIESLDLPTLQYPETNNNINTLDLSRLTSLKKVRLHRFTQQESPLTSLPQGIEELSIETYENFDLKTLRRFPNLQTLRVHAKTFENVEALTHLEALSSLVLCFRSSQEEPQNIACLATCKHLRHLEVRSQLVTGVEKLDISDFDSICLASCDKLESLLKRLIANKEKVHIAINEHNMHSKLYQSQGSYRISLGKSAFANWKRQKETKLVHMLQKLRPTSYKGDNIKMLGFFPSLQKVNISSSDANVQQDIVWNNDNRNEEINSLTLANIKTNNLDFLATMPMLQSLTLQGCHNIEDFRGLEKLKHLKTLTIQSCAIRNLDFLQYTTKLSSLNASGHRELQHFGGLAYTQHLKKLNLSASTLLQLSDLPELPGIEELNLSDCQALTSLQDIEKFAQLKRLSIATTRRMNLSPLLSLERLSSLNVSNCGYWWDEKNQRPRHLHGKAKIDAFLEAQRKKWIYKGQY